MSTFRGGRTASITAAAALMLAAAAPVAHAATPVVKFKKASISPSKIRTAHGSVGTPVKLHIDTVFSVNPPGPQLFTIQKAVVWFPSGAITNGKLFKNCSAAQIESFGKILSRCPRGSKVGSGSVTAFAIQLGVHSHGRVTMFNSHNGKAITFNIQTSIPANINESFDAPLTRVHGKFAYKLTFPVPESLQQILTGVFVGIEDFNVTASGTVRVHGRKRGYIEARSCPRNGKAPLHGDFNFADRTSGQQASTTADAVIRCKRA